MRITALCLVLLTLAAAAGAQEGLEDDPELGFAKPYSVPDTQDVFFLSVEARRAADSGSFDKAALKLQKILDFHQGSVIRIGSPRQERYVGAREWVHGLLAGLPEEGRAAYRAYAGPLARELIERAATLRDRPGLSRVLLRYYRSGEGPRALRALATLHLAEADYVEAAWHLRRIVEDFPGDAGSEDFARLAFALARSGAIGEYREFRSMFPSGDATGGIVVGGESMPLSDFLDVLDEEVKALEKATEKGATSWPFYGRTKEREAPSPSLSRVGSDGWAHATEVRPKREDYADGPRFGSRSFGSGGLPADHYPVQPVVDRGIVYFHNGWIVYAVNLYTGKKLWSLRGPFAANEGKTNRGTVFAPAVKDGVVFVNLEVKVPQPPADALHFGGRTVIYYIPQRRLFALDAATGKVLWSHQDSRIRDTPDWQYLEQINVNSPPLVIGDTLYVTASRQTQRYFSYLLAVDAATGKVKWRTRICTGQQELNLFGRPIKELASSTISERDGTLYYCSNLGVAAAVDRRTGTIRWITGYPIIQIPFSVRWYRTEERLPTWTNAPPVVTEDAVYFTPTDSRHLTALNRKDGSLRFRFDGSDPGGSGVLFRHLLGVGSRNLFVAGPRVLAMDRRTGKVVWRSSKGNFNSRRPNGEREEARGRGLVTERAVYTLTQRGLYSFDPVTGERLGFEPLEFQKAGRRRDAESGGNLVTTGEVLMVAQQESIQAYYLWERIYDELKRRADANPNDPHLALEMGEVYGQGQRYPEAVRAFRRALDLSDQIHGDERSRLAVSARRGLYRIHMLEGARSIEEDRRGEAVAHFRNALKAAVDDAGRIRAQLALADHYRFAGRKSDLRKTYGKIVAELGDVVYDFPSEGMIPAGLHSLMNLADMASDAGRAGEAIGYLTKIISDYPRRELLANVESQVYARDRIDRLIATHGRRVYSAIEKRSRALLRGAREKRSAIGLEAVTRLYPNSEAAREASLALGRLLLLAGDYRSATISIRRLLSEFPKSPHAPELLKLLADALEGQGYLLSARSALTRLLKRHPDARIEVDGETVTAAAYAERRLAEPEFSALASTERHLKLPLVKIWSDDEGDNSYVRVLEAGGIAPPEAEGLLLLGTNGVLRAVTAKDKRVLWRKEMNGITTKPLYAEGHLVLVNSSTISALGATSGETLWEIPNNASVRAVAANPGTVFVLTADFRDPSNLTLRALAPSTGETVWQKQLEDHQVYDLLLLTEEVVAVAARDPAGVTVFDAATGRLRFRVEMASRTLYREPFLVDEDKLFVVHGNQRFELYDMSTGRRLWETALPDERYFRSAIAVPGGIFITDTQERLHLLDVRDGGMRWTVPPQPRAPLQYQGEAADTKRVYVVRQQEETGFYLAEARDIRTGEALWTAKLVASKSATPEPLLTETHIIYHVNSYDFGQSAWTATSVFLDKKNGRPKQKLSPDELKGFFTYAFLREGIFCLNARGKVAVFGPE